MKDNKKIVGWVILSLGLITIFWSLYTSFLIFTGRTNPPELFQAEEVDPLPKRAEMPMTQEALEQEMERLIGEQISGLIPEGAIPDILNLMAWSIMTGIMIFGGSRLAEIGIKLLKE